MLNNILNGYRPLIIKIGVISLLVLCVFPYAWSAAEDVFEIKSTWTCGPTLQLGKALSESAGESIVLAGTMNEGAISFTLWANSKTRSWTAVATSNANPEISCIIVNGENLSVIMPRETI